MVMAEQWMARLPVLSEIAIVTLAAWLTAGWLLPTQQTMRIPQEQSAGRESTSIDLKLIRETPIFGVEKEAPPAPVEKPKPVVVSRLNIKLLGTVVAGDRSAAVVKIEGSREQQAFFVGDTMSPGVVLNEVEADAIVVDHNGSSERIELEQGNKLVSVAPTYTPPTSRPSYTPPAGPTRRMSRRMIDSQMQNFPLLLSQARVIPHFENGKSDGFLISNIVAGSLYEKAGLQNGDIIRKVNGVQVTSPQQAMQMFQELKNASSIDVEIVRAGGIQQVHYDIQ